MGQFLTSRERGDVRRPARIKMARLRITEWFPRKISSRRYGFYRPGSLLGYKVTPSDCLVDTAERRTGGGKHVGVAFAVRQRVVGSIAWFLLIAAPAGANEAVYDIDIPAQNAAAALERLAEQTGAITLFPYDLASGIQANAVVGRYTLPAALNVLLDGSGLSGGLSEKRVITIATSVNDESAQGEENMNEKTAGILATIGSIFLGTAANAQDADSQANQGDSLEEIVVTGTRGKPRSVTDSPVAVDVFSAEELDGQPQTGLFETMRFLVPSLNMPQRAGGGTATFISSAGLRGLNPDQTLILVNGKRRHRTALINTSTGLFSGAAGVDLNMIPKSAIKRIEVLRDGAAAQYGSDAIAGVINIILEDRVNGGRATASSGENFDRGDGDFLNAGLNTGFELGQSGFINLSFDYMDSDFSNRARPVPIPGDPANPGGLNLYPILPGDTLDPREFTIDRLVTSNFGNFPRRTYVGSINVGYELDNVELYGFATYADRDSILDFTFRRPRDSRAIPEIFPQGFRPTELISEEDYEIAAGVRGAVGDFEWDFSLNAGENEATWRNTLGLNASLGALSPTSFYLGQLIAEEFTTQLDVTRAYSLSSGGELQVSFGAQFRREDFKITEGEPLSYADGNNGLAAGAQGFPGFSPEAVNDLSRDNINAYVELGWDPTDRLFLGVAARYEDFDDSSEDEFIGKISGRYQVTNAIGIRASANTGFRAPSVQQLGFRGSRGQFADLDNDGIAETIVLRQTLPSTDAAAQALGAEPLTPETSTNFSIGVTFESDFGLMLTVDYYQIDVDDRVALSTQFNRGDNRPAASGGTIGDEISALLDAAGFDSSLGGVNYFTNAIDTRSRGVDVVATWSVDTDVGSFDFSGAYNHSDLTVESVDPNPEELSGLILADGSPIVQFDRARLGTYTDEFPESKFTLSSTYAYNSFVANVRATQFGSFTEVQVSEANDRPNDSEWIWDVEFGYQFQGGLGLYAGSNNVFNTYPEETRNPSSLGNGFYDTISPYGFTGGTWYVRGTLDW